MAFGESLAVFVGDERTVVPGWLRQSQCAANQYLSSCGLEQIGPANHFCNRHRSVIDSDSELIGRHSVFSPDEEVAEVLAGNESLRPEVAVIKLNGLAV